MKRSLRACWQLLLCVAMLPLAAHAQNYEAEFQRRAQYLTNQVADVYAFSAPGRDGVSTSIPDPEKYNWPPTIARLYKYCLDDSVANRRINTMRNNPPFHFTLVGMARIINLFPNAPAMREHRLTYLRGVWNRTDSYNAWTIEGTENHLNMSRTSGYLFAEEMLKHPQHFPVAQVTARRDSMKAWILRMTRQVLMTGNAEWNSSTYEVYNLIGWLNLYDFARDGEVRNAAKAMLDYLTTEIALHYSQGILGGAESRGNATQSVRTGTDYLAWLWFGDATRNPMVSGFWNGNDFIQSMHAVTSSYRPDPILVKLARKEIGQGNMYVMGRPGYLYETRGTVHNTFFIGQNFTLGATSLPYLGFAGGNSQFTNWKMVARVDTPATTAIMVAGGGRYYNLWSGRARHPYDQFAHNRKVILQMTRTPVDHAAIQAAVQALYTPWQDQWRADFIQRFGAGDVKLTMGTNGTPINTQTPQNSGWNTNYVSWPAGFTSVVNSGVTFVNFGRVFMAVRSLSQAAPSAEANEANANRRQVNDQAPLGSICGLAIEFDDAANHADFAAFQSAIIAAGGLDKSQLASSNSISYRGLDNQIVSMTYNINNNPNPTEPIYDWGYGPTSQLVWHSSPPFLQPNWSSLTNLGRQPSVAIDGVDPFAQTPEVFQGPGLNLRDGRLAIRDGADSSSVAYLPATDRFASLSTRAPRLGNLRLCSNDSAIAALPSDYGGSVAVTGPGLVNGKFDPSVAGVGTHTLTYAVGSNTYNRDIEVLGAPTIYLANGPLAPFCVGQPANLDLVIASPGNGKVQWFRNDTLLPTAVSPNITVTDPGRYYAVFRKECCAAKSNETVVTFASKPTVAAAVRNDSLISNGSWPAGAVITWTFPGGAELVGRNIKPTVSGLYTVIVNNNGCGDTAQITYTSVRQQLDSRLVTLAPNPAHDQLQVTVDLPGTSTVAVLDLLGRVLMPAQTVANGTTPLAIGSLPQGTYLLRVSHVSGTAVKRFVKE